MNIKGIGIIILILTFIFQVKAQQATPQALAAHRKMWGTPAWADTLRNPYANKLAMADSGHVLYKNFCVVCHGESGKGNGVAAAGLSVPPADHTSPLVQALPIGDLYWELTTGHSPMPSYKAILTDKQRWQLVNYIKTLHKK